MQTLVSATSHLENTILSSRQNYKVKKKKNTQPAKLCDSKTGLFWQVKSNIALWILMYVTKLQNEFIHKGCTQSLRKMYPLCNSPTDKQFKQQLKEK